MFSAGFVFALISIPLFCCESTDVYGSSCDEMPGLANVQKQAQIRDGMHHP
jgi:hypothetical protein